MIVDHGLADLGFHFGIRIVKDFTDAILNALDKEELAVVRTVAVLCLANL